MAKAVLEPVRLPKFHGWRGHYFAAMPDGSFYLINDGVAKRFDIDISEAAEMVFASQTVSILKTDGVTNVTWRFDMREGRIVGEGQTRIPCSISHYIGFNEVVDDSGNIVEVYSDETLIRKPKDQQGEDIKVVKLIRGPNLDYVVLGDNGFWYGGFFGFKGNRMRGNIRPMRLLTINGNPAVLENVQLDMNIVGNTYDGDLHEWSLCDHNSIEYIGYNGEIHHGKNDRKAWSLCREGFVYLDNKGRFRFEDDIYRLVRDENNREYRFECIACDEDCTSFIGMTDDGYVMTWYINDREYDNDDPGQRIVDVCYPTIDGEKMNVVTGRTVKSAARKV